VGSAPLTGLMHREETKTTANRQNKILTALCMVPPFVLKKIQ